MQSMDYKYCLHNESFLVLNSQTLIKGECFLTRTIIKIQNVYDLP